MHVPRVERYMCVGAGVDTERKGKHKWGADKKRKEGRG